METDIYFDNSATTALSDTALAAMEQAARQYGNPSSLHHIGLEAEKAYIAHKRKILAAMGFRLHADERNLIITGSGTEANNLAILGCAFAKPHNRKMKIMTDDSEHPSVSEPIRLLESLGFSVIRIGTRNGELDMEAIERASKDVFLASFMMVNNETGARYAVEEAFSILRRKNPTVFCHADAVQAFLKFTDPLSAATADAISISAHKIGGPKGCGALYVSNAALQAKRLNAVILGGGQEYGLRSGTENTIGVAGFAAACEERSKNLDSDTSQLSLLKQRLLSGLRDIPGILIHCPSGNWAPHIVNIALPGVKSEILLRYLSKERIYVSSGSACSSHKNTVSPVLTAFGITSDEADCSVRVSFKPENREDEVDRFLSVLREGVSHFASFTRNYKKRQ